MTTEHDFIVANPLLAESARQFESLTVDEQRGVLPKLIDGAVYCDSWIAYFQFALRSGITVSDDIGFEAVQAVGLDPCSVNLWILAAKACADKNNMIEVLNMALSVPLYESHILTRFIKSLDDKTSLISTSTDLKARQAIEKEVWPDRFADMTKHEERVRVRQQWIGLMDSLTTSLDSGLLERDIQLQRMDLAYRQMCLQLKEDDSCWYEYALFQVHVLKDEKAAEETARAGLSSVSGASFALQSLLSYLAASSSSHESQQTALISQRALAENMASQSTSQDKNLVKMFRNVGKTSAQNGTNDWKLYSQWYRAESYVVKDEKMASKVLDNGMICCSSSPNSSILLGNEGIEYHLRHRHDREALGFAEHQIEISSSSKHRGVQRAAWNKLVRTEHDLGLSYSKAEGRRGDVFPSSHFRGFLENYRVGNYLPCSESMCKWIEFTEDYKSDRNESKEISSRDTEAASSKVLCPLSYSDSQAANVCESSWPVAVVPANSFTANNDDDPDDVVGPRELRGKWVYRIKVDKATELRTNRDERLRAVQANDASNNTPQNSLGTLLKRIKALTTTDEQITRLSGLSADWIIDQIVSSELDLNEILKGRSHS